MGSFLTRSTAKEAAPRTPNVYTDELEDSQSSERRYLPGAYAVTNPPTHQHIHS